MKNYRWFLTKLWSQVLYKMTLWQFPAWLIQCVIKKLVDHYQIDVSEIDRPLTRFKSVNEFFTRTLKPGARPVDASPDAFISPVDAVVKNYGSIREDKLLQAKGVDYPVESLIPGSFAERFRDGDYMTLYLSPRDMHLIFSPVAGKVIASGHVPGGLYKVRDPFPSKVPGLYALNERLTSYVETCRGLVAVVKVGALNVARITTTYDSEINTDRLCASFREKVYPTPFSVERGGQLGTFNFGSTVIVLFEKGMIRFLPNMEGTHVQYGQKIGEIPEGA